MNTSYWNATINDDCTVTVNLTDFFGTRKTMIFGECGTIDEAAVLASDINLTGDALRLGAAIPLIQDVFPNQTKEEREFLISGTTPEEWEIMFPKEKEDETP